MRYQGQKAPWPKRTLRERFILAWRWYSARAVNRNFEKPFNAIDVQGKVHIVSSRKQLWMIAWRGYGPHGA